MLHAQLNTSYLKANMMPVAMEVLPTPLWVPATTIPAIVCKEMKVAQRRRLLYVRACMAFS